MIVEPSDPDAASQIAVTPSVSKRNIITYYPVRPGLNGIEFKWNELTDDLKLKLDNRQEVLDYVRGNKSCETNSQGTCPGGQTKNLRDRAKNARLGTIVNSSPIYVGGPADNYPDKWVERGTEAPENAATQKYSDFIDDYASREPVLYVGANDGMLHAFDAATLQEVFAFMPSTALPTMVDFATTDSHKYRVDGTPTVLDAFFTDNKWHTVLTSGLNKGGQAIFTLDVTEVNKGNSTLATEDVLWEFTDTDDADLGYTYSRPAIVRMYNNKWVVVFGNGYNNTEADGHASDTGDAALYIVDIQTGNLIRKISTNVGTAEDPTGGQRPNGLATVAPVDLDNDYIADYIYAGDLFGNLWRFDVTDANPSNWKIYGRDATANPIFKAVDANGNPQPITSRPSVTKTNIGGYMVYFGTGMYLQLADKVDLSPQTFYGVLDDPLGDYTADPKPEPVVRADMVKQEVKPQQHSLTLMVAKALRNRLEQSVEI